MVCRAVAGAHVDKPRHLAKSVAQSRRRSDVVTAAASTSADGGSANGDPSAASQPPSGCTRIDAVLDAAACARLLAEIDTAIGALRLQPDHADFSRYSSSLRLRALPTDGSGAPVRLARHLLQGAVGAAIAGRREAPRWLLMPDQCWARRQYAPHRYPPDHHPHGWHQDGALHLDFDAPRRELLRMLTCWIALTPCGDTAPGLEVIRPGLADPLQPADLTDGAISARFDPATRWRPVMAAGDALLFDGGTVHRTLVEPAMRDDRTSIELRFLAAGPQPARRSVESLVDID